MTLGSGLTNMTKMACDMARNARRSAKSGVGTPVEGFDAAVRSRIARPLDRAVEKLPEQQEDPPQPIMNNPV